MSIVTDMLQDIEVSNNSKKESNFFKPVEGKNIVRLLPVMYNGNPGIPYKSHYIGKKFILCAGGNDCPMCQKGWELHNELKTTNPQEAKNARAKWLSQQKIALTVSVNGVAKIYNVTQPQFKEIADLDSNGANLFDVDEGRDLIITKTGKGLATKYQFSHAVNSSKLVNATSIMQNAPDLEDFINGQKLSMTQMLELVVSNE